MTSQVGFTAGASTGWTTSFLGGVGSRIRFPVVNYNRGGRYSSSLSHFSCNDNKIYFFAATIYADANKWIDYCIYDGITKHCGATGLSKGASSGTITALLRCSPGRQVRVIIEAKSHSSVKVLSKFCRFTGFRL